MRKKTQEDFIREADKIHNSKYDYSKTEYVNMRTKVCIICPEHGEFWQKPSTHIQQRCGCPKCGGKLKKTKTDFVVESRKVHGYRYDYSKVDYVNSHTKVCIVCPEHGDFLQTPTDHLQGHGCPECARVRKMDDESFTERSREIHGGKYNYQKVRYVNSRTNVTIICPEHGEFLQTPVEHLRGHGCPECALKILSRNRKDFDDYLPKFREVHGDKYVYDPESYISSTERIRITCPVHGEFWQNPYDHACGHGCPKCGSTKSSGEEELVEFLEEIQPHKVTTRRRDIIPPSEIDIYIEELRVGFEYDGLYWHSDKFKVDKDYHLSKTIQCADKGIRLIHIFENEWLYNKEAAKDCIRRILGMDNPQTGKCTISEIPLRQANAFLKENDMKGKCRADVSIGLFSEGVLQGVMCFRKKKAYWEMVRNVKVTREMFTYFTKTYNPSIVKVSADRRWFPIHTDNIYTELGFRLERYTKPKCHYFNNKRHLYERMRKDCHRIWDCGSINYVWENIENNT